MPSSPAFLSLLSKTTCHHIILVQTVNGRVYVQYLLARVLKCRVPFRYYAFTVQMVLGLFAAPCLLNRFTTGSWPNVALFGEVDYLPHLTPISALGVLAHYLWP